MISTTNLYSLRGSEPTTIPNRLKFDDGTTKTDVTTFTEEDIANAGWEGPYNIPEYDPDRYIPRWNSENMSWYMIDHPVWVDQNTEPTVEQQTNGIREYRNYLLQVSDFSQLPDAPLTAAEKAEWVIYRQQLRDVPTQRFI